jgi:hypothetical protein
LAPKDYLYEPLQNDCTCISAPKIEDLPLGSGTGLQSTVSKSSERVSDSKYRIRRFFATSLCRKIRNRNYRARFRQLTQTVSSRPNHTRNMSDGIGNDGLSANGWAAVPRDFAKSLADVDKNEHAEMTVRDANPPNTNIVKRTHEFAKERLPERTFNHSMRVWYYGKRSSRHYKSIAANLLISSLT